MNKTELIKAIEIPASKGVKFKAGKNLKEAVN